jgi:hypothetical protein
MSGEGTDAVSMVVLPVSATAKAAADRFTWLKGARDDPGRGRTA